MTLRLSVEGRRAAPSNQTMPQDFSAHHLNARLFAFLVFIPLTEWLNGSSFLRGVGTRLVMHSGSARGFGDGHGMCDVR